MPNLNNQDLHVATNGRTSRSQQQLREAQKSEASNAWNRKLLKRKASLSEAELYFLHALLVDNDATDTRGDDDSTRESERSFDDDVMRSIPAQFVAKSANDEEQERRAEKAGELTPLVPPTRRRDTSLHVGLWRAHEEGVTSAKLLRYTSCGSGSDDASPQMRDGSPEGPPEVSSQHSSIGAEVPSQSAEVATEVNEDDADWDSDDDGIPSDASVDTDSDSVANSASSWGLDDGGFDHYDAWQLLKDEYATDFGYTYANGTDNVFGEGYFHILGTSADDVDSQPHVLSPPLMESLSNFLPERLSMQNWWLKFSLVRDGASIITLRELCRDSQYTILALETATGGVFGSFTSAPWRKTYRYFGTGEAFLWKMRHSRKEPCHSIFEQAKLESEIDVFPFSGLNYYVQLCTNDKLAIGGGQLIADDNKKTEDTPTVALESIASGDEADTASFRYTPYGGNNEDACHPEIYDPLTARKVQGEKHKPSNAFGFGIAINSDLLFGTSSPCATFRNPSLSSHSGGEDVFEIVNLEVWTFTPCETLEEAESLEEMKSIRSDMSSRSSSVASSLSRTAGVASYFQEIEERQALDPREMSPLLGTPNMGYKSLLSDQSSYKELCM